LAKEIDELKAAAASAKQAADSRSKAKEIAELKAAAASAKQAADGRSKAAAELKG